MKHKNAARALGRVLAAAELTDGAGQPKYPALHALRHFYAFWCINRRADGGLELPAKMVQERLIHYASGPVVPRLPVRLRAGLFSLIRRGDR